jgi:rare lipoprotein A
MGMGRSFVVPCVILLFAGHTAQAESGIASIYAYASSKTASGSAPIQAGSRPRIARCRSAPWSKSPIAAMASRSPVRINDRGPFIRGRVTDVTPAAAQTLGFSGLAPVSLAVLGRS